MAFSQLLDAAANAALLHAEDFHEQLKSWK